MRQLFFGIIGGFILVAGLYFFGGNFLEKLSPTGLSILPDKSALSAIVSEKKQPSEAVLGVNTEQKKDLILLAKFSDNTKLVNSSPAWDDLYIFDNGISRTLTPPDYADRNTKPVTDGEKIYFIVNKDGNSKSNRSLVAQNISDGKQTLITDSTPLVEPRTVFASPEGNTVAFFLDSTKKNMTELWTYVPEKARKRVSVERLSKNTVGPYWDANGGFILRDNAKILRGSPNRTGVDLLPVKLDWQNILSGSAMIPSPGGTQLIYLVGKTDGDKKSSVLRLWDMKDNKERDIATFLTDQVSLLGWSKQGSLVVAEGGDAPKIWNIAKEARENYDLESSANNIMLSSDGTAVAYILSGAEGEMLFVRDVKTGKIISQDIVFSNVNNSEQIHASGVGVLQFLRVAVTPSSFTKEAEFPLAKDVIVGYVMGHIREIAAVAESESATAQRVWFTNTPGAVYVDYLVGTTLWRRLVQIEGVAGQASSHAVIGVYAPAAGEWVLASGRDLAESGMTELYEYDPDLDKWLKKVITKIQP